MIRPLFPLKPGEKTPLKANYKAQASSDSEVIRGWLKAGYNLGYCPCMGGETVIDLDKHGDKDGEEAFAKWEDSIGKHLPATLTVITPSGGKHLYFSGLAPYDKLGFLPGVDIISAKRYVVAPGSKTEKGVYGACDTFIGVAELPQWFLDEMNRMRRPAAESAPSSPAASTVNLRIDPDTPEKIAAAVELVQNWPEAVEGERNHSLFMLACELCKAGITELRARDIYAKHGMERLHYGADQAEWHEVCQTIRSAYMDKAAEFGAATRQSVLGLLGPAKYGMEDWRAIAAMPVPDRKWLVNEWLLAEPGTVHLFSGQGGTGKSLIAMLLAYSLATGEPFLGMTPERKAKSIIVSCEDPMPEQARRLQRIEKSLGAVVPEGIVKIWCRTGENNVLAYSTKQGFVAPTDFLKELQGKCAEHFGRDGGILVLDTLSDFVAINENDRMQVSQFVKHVLTKFASELGITMILLAHPNKTNAGFSGSTAWEGAVRSRWELAWQKQGGEAKVGSLLVLRLAKSNTTMAGKEIVLRYGEDHLPHVAEAAREDTAVRDLIVGMVEEAVREGNPFGRGMTSRRPIVKASIEDPVTGVVLEQKEVEELVGSLLAEGRIVVKRNKEINFLATPGETASPPIPPSPSNP